MRARGTLLAAGAFSLVAQTFLLREFLAVSRGTAMVVGLFMCGWLLWVMAGAWAGRKVSATAAGRLLPWAALAAPIALPLQVAGFRSLLSVAGLDPALALPAAPLALGSFLLVAPSAFLSGLIFPLAAATIADRDPSASYGWEAAGCFTGGALFTALILQGVSPAGVAGMSAALLGLAALRRGTALAAVAVMIMGLAAPVFGPDLQEGLARQDVEALLPGATFVAGADTPRARMALAELPDQLVILQDGMVAAALPTTSGSEPERLQAAVAMAQATGRSGPAPARVLLIGSWPHAILPPILEYAGVEQVELVVPDQEAWAFALPHLPDHHRDALDDPRVALHFGDARRILPATGPHDLVFILDIDPTDLPSNRLHTVEFHRILRGSLAPAGVVTVPGAGAANYMGQEVGARGGITLATLEEAYEQVVLLTGDTTTFFATPRRGRLTADPDELAARHRRTEGAPAIPPHAIASASDQGRLPFVEAIYRASLPPGVHRLNTDRKPAAHLLSVMAQGRQAGEGWVDMVRRLAAAGPWAFWTPLLLAGSLPLLRLARHRSAAGADEPRATAAVFLAAAGFTGLAMGILLLVAFQLHAGTLFGKIGLLNATLLAGVALGALAGERLLRRSAPPRADALPWPALLVSLLLGGFSLALPGLLASLPGGPGAEAWLLALAGLAGLLSGMAFPAGALLARGTGSLAGHLFAADHMGAALAAITVGLATIPLLGVAGTCLLLAGLQGAVLLFLASRWLSARLPRPAARPRDLFPWPRLVAPLAVAALTAAVIATLAAVRPSAESAGITARHIEGAQGVALWESRDEPFPHHVGLDAQGRPAQVLVESRASGVEVMGYGGPLNFLVGIDSQGVYRRIEVLSHQETPAWFRRVEPTFAALEGRSALEPLVNTDRGGDVDAISGATVTLEAGLATLNGVAAQVTGSILDLGGEAQTGDRATRLPAAAWYLLLAIPASIAVLARGGRRVRMAFLLVTMAVGGIWLNAQISLAALMMPLHGHLPALDAPMAAVMLYGLLLLTLLFGAAWCGALCPFGAAQEILGRLGFRLSVPSGLDRRLRGLKYVVLVALLAGFALTGQQAFLTSDPLAWAFAGQPELAPGLLVLLALGASAAVFRAWCRYLCPMGALLSLGNRLAPLQRLLPSRRYTRCDLGVTSRQDMDCIQCNRCTWPGDRSSGPVVPRSGGTARTPGRAGATAATLVAAASVILLALSISSGWRGLSSRPERATEPTAAGWPAAVDEIRRQIEAGDLAGREAMYWETAE